MRVFDCHIHVQPWEQLKPGALSVMTAGRRDLPRIERALAEPAELLRLMDEQGVERAALINYSAPDVLGFTETVNDWVSAFVRGHEDRLVAVGSVHPRFARDAASETGRLFERLGIRMLKLHPPHQLFAANGYREGDEALRQIYATAEAMGRPVMIHTGTPIRWRPMTSPSIFRGFRSSWRTRDGRSSCRRPPSSLAGTRTSISTSPESLRRSCSRICRAWRTSRTSVSGEPTIPARASSR